MILGFILLQDDKSSEEVGYGNENEIAIFFLSEQYFPKATS